MSRILKCFLYLGLGCKRKALRNAEVTLANVAKLKVDNATHQ